MHRIGITDFLQDPAPLQRPALDGLARVECLAAREESQLVGRVEEMAGLIVFHEIQLTEATINRLDTCRVIVRGGVGYDNIDAEAAGRNGIYVCNVPDYGVDEVADHAIGMMLAVLRKIVYADHVLKTDRSNWNHFLVEPVPRLAGSTMGIVGLGRIGTATALRARAFKMHVVAHDPYIPDGQGKALGVEMVSLDELLAVSDVVSLHTPLTEETRHMIDSAALTAMKSSGVLINTARGAVVDLAALSKALADEQIAGAGIDVLPNEPPDPDHPLIRMWEKAANGTSCNLVITPHVAFYSSEGLGEICEKSASEVARVLNGHKPRNPVNVEHYVPKNGRG